MAMLRMEAAFAGYPQTCTVAGGVAFTNTGAVTANTLVTQAAISQAANTPGAQIGPQSAVTPLSSKVQCVLFPTPAYKPQVATNCTNTHILLDFSGFPGLLCSLQVQGKAASVTPAGIINTVAYNAAVLDIDQTNKFAYVQVLTAAGAAVSPASGVQLFFTACFIDSAYP